MFIITTMLCVNVLQVPVNFLRLIPEWCQELKDLPQMAQKFLLGDVLVEKDLKYKGAFYFILILIFMNNN